MNQCRDSEQIKREKEKEEGKRERREKEEAKEGEKRRGGAVSSRAMVSTDLGERLITYRTYRAMDNTKLNKKLRGRVSCGKDDAITGPLCKKKLCKSAKVNHSYSV